MKLTTARITTLLLLLSAVVLLALSACSSDGSDWSDGSKNTAPVADAGMDQHPKTGSFVTLDGSGSHDADHDLLAYDWSMTKPNGSNATLSDTSSSHPTFTADVDGEYVIELTVNDGLFDSAPDSVRITAETINSKPVAHAGVDQHPTTGSLVTLDGSGSSDADGDSLTYLWTITAWPFGSTAQISDVHAETTTFTPDVDGDYIIELIVRDIPANAASAPDSVTITAETANSRPVAHAGGDQQVTTGREVTLDGSGSTDADGDTLEYKWNMTSRPTGSTATLSVPADASHPFFTPDANGSYVIKLIVNDGKVDSDQDSVTVHVGCISRGACLVFATSDTLTGNLGGLVGADKSCNDLAKAAGLPGTYKAWLSTSSEDAGTRMSVPDYTPFHLPPVAHGTTVTVVVTRFNQFTYPAYDLAHAIDRDEHADPVTTTRVFTGTRGTGSAAFKTCTDWGDDAKNVYGTTGLTSEVKSQWTNNISWDQCGTPARRYCMQQSAAP